MPNDELPSDLQLTGVQNDSFHDSSDADTGALAIHHTLGTGINQAAAGDHQHADLQSQIDTLNSDVATMQADITALENPPQAQINGDTVTSIPNNAWTDVKLYTENWKVGVTHSASAAAIVCPTAGKYLVIAHGGVDFNTTGKRGIILKVGGTQILESEVMEDANLSVSNLTMTARLVNVAAGQSVIMQLYQNSGGALNSLVSSSLELIRVSD